MGATRILTVGHSSRSLEDFLGILRAHGVAHVADVRAFPRSRRHPHFDRDALAAALRGAGIAYAHLPELGGHRTPRPDSPHVALPAGAFRGYADHMDTPAFAAGVARLLALEPAGAVAAMCAEARPGECHRALLSDALVSQGVAVDHLLDAATRAPHVRHPLARLDGGRLVYAGAQERLGL